VNLSRLFAPDDGRDAMRTFAGLLLGAGFFMAWARKSSTPINGWGDWGLLVTLLIITVFLYGVGLMGRLNTASLRAWQSVYIVFGILLIPFTLFQFIEAVGGTAGTDLNVFWVLLVTAGAAAFAALVADVQYGMLLASIAIVVAWSALWDKILSNGVFTHYGIYRGLLVIIGLILVAVALAVHRLDLFSRLRPGGPAPEEVRWRRGNDVITGAAIAGVAAGALTFTAFFAQASVFAVRVASPSLLWDIELLIASLLAVLWGARFGVRGPTYVGGIGLLIFIINVGSEVGVNVPQSTIVGWPLILALVGAGLFVISLIPSVETPDAEARLRGTGSGTGPTGAAAPPTGGTGGATP
jgi:hypothetical protein